MSFHIAFNSLFCARSTVREHLIDEGSAPLVSVSGGQDSIFLAWCIFQLQAEKKLRPLWLYHNHLWHAEGFFHGVHCLRLAFLFGWPFIYTVPMHNAFDEEMAWDFRQHLRGRLCTFYALDDVLLGHTKTDQTESFLYHLLRGSFQSADASSAFPIFPEQRYFASESSASRRASSPVGSGLPAEASSVTQRLKGPMATTPTLFALEGSSLSFAAPVFLVSACAGIRRNAFF